MGGTDFLLPALVVCAATGCVTKEPAFIPLASEMSQRITSSNVVIVATQKELVADVDKSRVSTATGGGLIPALIDVAIESSRASSAEDNLRPIRNAIFDFEMGKELQQALGTRLDEVPWLHVKKTDVVYDKKAEQLGSLLAAGSEDVLVVISPTYALSSDFSVLRVESQIRVVPRAAQFKSQEDAKADEGKVTPLYKKSVSYLSSLATFDPGSKEDAAKAWASDGGVRIKEALKQGVATVATRIVDSLTHPVNSVAVP